MRPIECLQPIGFRRYQREPERTRDGAGSLDRGGVYERIRPHRRHPRQNNTIATNGQPRKEGLSRHGIFFDPFMVNVMVIHYGATFETPRPDTVEIQAI